MCIHANIRGVSYIEKYLLFFSPTSTCTTAAPYTIIHCLKLFEVPWNATATPATVSRGTYYMVHAFTRPRFYPLLYFTRAFFNLTTSAHSIYTCMYICPYYQACDEPAAVKIPFLHAKYVCSLRKFSVTKHRG